MGIQQGDLLRGALFALAHFRALCSTTSHFPSCLFPSILNDTHIINPLSIVSSAYEHFQTEFLTISFSIQLQKCITWSFFVMPLHFNTPSQFTTPYEGIRLLRVLLSTLTFISSFTTLLWEECEYETHIPELGTWVFVGISGVKTPCIGAFFISLESYKNIDVENGLTWAISTSATQVMVKRKAGSQIGSLTPDHKKLRINLTSMHAGGVWHIVRKLLMRATSFS
jgi:hypothetical protein